MWLVQNMETKKIPTKCTSCTIWEVQNVVSTKHVEIKHRECTTIVFKNIQNTNKGWLTEFTIERVAYKTRAVPKMGNIKHCK